MLLMDFKVGYTILLLYQILFYSEVPMYILFCILISLAYNLRTSY